MGIEPTSKAWEAFILPLNYTRGEPPFYGRCSVLATRCPLSGSGSMRENRVCRSKYAPCYT